MKILAIETSCDETSLALIQASGGLSKPQFKILKYFIASQIKIHRPFGGVVPSLAKREHLKNLPVLLKKLTIYNSQLKTVDLIAVTVGPGLEPCLWTGINFAEDLAKKLKKPLVGVNHLEGHLYSFLLEQKRVISKSNPPADGPKPKIFPAVSLIVSGGHTILLLMKDLKTIKKLGETRDDAIGEAFDKVARLLGLSYPGGPELEKLAKNWANSINFPRPMIKDKNYDFSFSGLKTSVFYYMRDRNLSTNNEFVTNKQIEKITIGKFERDLIFADVAASFQSAAIDVLIRKTIRAAEEFRAKSIMISGGVAANKELRRRFKIEANKKKLKLLIPDFKFCTDNAVIIGAAAYIGWLKKKKYKIEADGNLNFKI